MGNDRQYPTRLLQITSHLRISDSYSAIEPSRPSPKIALASSVWVANSRGRSWSCDQCKDSPSLRRSRGNCGGSFKSTLPQSMIDDDGSRYVPGYRIAPNCGLDYGDYKIKHCPISDINRLASIITTYHRHRRGTSKISDVYPSPSCAMIDAIDTLHAHTEAMIDRQREQSLKEVRDG